MAKKILSVTLSEETTKKVDRTSKALGMSRSEFVEIMINKGFEFSKEALDSTQEISKLQDKAKNKIQQAQE
jgi:metal-responsive CopG/Arc/MetJ family transcriptional regulator